MKFVFHFCSTRLARDPRGLGEPACAAEYPSCVYVSVSFLCLCVRLCVCVGDIASLCVGVEEQDTSSRKCSKGDDTPLPRLRICMYDLHRMTFLFHELHTHKYMCTRRNTSASIQAHTPRDTYTHTGTHIMHTLIYRRTHTYNHLHEQ